MSLSRVELLRIIVAGVLPILLDGEEFWHWAASPSSSAGDAPESAEVKPALTCESALDGSPHRIAKEAFAAVPQGCTHGARRPQLQR
jgi:hypothetical protein